MSAYRTPAAVSITADDWIQMGLEKGLTLASFEEAIHNHSASSSEEATPFSGDGLKLTLDYSLSKLQMIAAGKYDYVNDFLRNNNPIEGKIGGSGQVEVTLELVHFDRGISTKDALKEIQKRGLEPAGIEHLLALGVKHPDLQREFSIVALGSVWRHSLGFRRVSYLWDGGGVRKLRLDWDDGGWLGNYRFLAVRK